MQSQEFIIGIDLGTTNSEVAIVENGQPILLLDAQDGSGMLPSVVGLDPQGSLLVGRAARNQMVVAPEYTVASIKRKMGGEDRIVLGEQSYSPQEISAFILRALKERAEKHLGVAVAKAVVTVPAYFTDAQRQATREAGAIAGLEVVRILNEPTAAALAYGASITDGGKILVYDLGGGTFDVSIVSAEAGIVEVLATAGDNHLGGDDFDEAIVQVLMAYLEKNHGAPSKEDPRLRARLRRAAEEAKVKLSSEPYVQIEEDHLYEVNGVPVHLRHELSRHDFEDLLGVFMDRTMECVERALADANVRPSELKKIILVGGSSRIPLVRQRLRERLAQEPHEEIDPDVCVALGASLQAGMDMGLQVDSVLVDVTPYTFGTSCLGSLHGSPYKHEFAPIINRNSKLPVEKSQVFFRVHNEQTVVSINVYQGENPDAMSNVLVGNFLFEGLTPFQGDRDPGVVLSYRLNVDGILQVTAIERTTGKQMSCTIENAMTPPDADALRASQMRLAEAWSQQDDDDDLELSLGASSLTEASVHGATSAVVPDIELQQLLDRARKIVEKAEPDDRTEIMTLINSLCAIEASVETEHQKARHKLEDLLFYLE